jgi:hypothetical protein
MRDFRDAKAMAHTLRESLAGKAVAISHSESLELVSRMLGVADWNTLSAMLPDRRGPPAPSGPGPQDEVERLRAEQARPRTAVAFEPEDFDRFVGFYELNPVMIFTVSRNGDHFFTQLPGQPALEIFPESPTKFFAKAVPAQHSFVTDASGRVTELIHHQNGREQHAPRIDAAEAKAKRAGLEARFRSQAPDPRSEPVLRREIEALVANEPPDATVMRPDMWEHINKVRPQGHATVAALGRLRSIDFAGVSQTGFDVYTVWYEDGVQRWSIRMGEDGLIEGIFFAIGP